LVFTVQEIVTVETVPRNLWAHNAHTRRAEAPQNGYHRASYAW
jgi:hypothetical protein